MTSAVTAMLEQAIREGRVNAVTARYGEGEHEPIDLLRRRTHAASSAAGRGHATGTKKAAVRRN